MNAQNGYVIRMKADELPPTEVWGDIPVGTGAVILIRYLRRMSKTTKTII